MNRKISYWKLRSIELQLGERTMIMGILNVTPDSFSDGGRFNDPDSAYARALELEEEGADIIDIGGESTKPGSRRISAEEEWQRLVPVLKRLRGQLHVPLSIDTYKAETAERALEYGIEIINDPSGLTLDPELARIAASGNAGLILSHMRGTPESWAKLAPIPDPADAIARELDATVNRARHAGVERQRIVVDPGLGFGKRKEQNAEVIAHLRELVRLECPIMIGPSRKSFLAQETEEETRMATAAAVTAGILNGAHIVRVHDVKLMRATVMYADEVARASRIPTRAEREEEERREAKAEARSQRGVLRPFETTERHAPPRPPLLRKTPAEAIASPEPNLETPEEPATEVASIEAPSLETSPPPPAPAPAEPKPVERKSFDRKPVERRPVRDGSAPPRRSFSDRAPRKDFGKTDRPPRRFDDREKPVGPPSGDRPPRRFGDRDKPAGPPRGDRPPRRFGDRDKPAGPPRGDRPPRRFGDRDKPAGPPRGDRPPRRFGDRDKPAGPPRGDRPPRRLDDRDKRTAPPRGDRPPRGDGPPKFAPRGGPKRGPDGRPPKRPFRKRP